MADIQDKSIGKAPSIQDGAAYEKRSNSDDMAEGLVERDNADHLKRHLGNRQIQLIAIGGAIGTALFVSIGGGLQKGGPGSLFLAFSIQAIMVAFVTTGLAEMVTWHPISGSFIRFAGGWVDEAWGFATGVNFFLYEAFLIPFEIAALNLVLEFWSDKIPVAAVIVACIVLYALLNIVAVQYFGEAEFWLAGGKVILILIVFSFTFVTMVGGNPQHDAYGFRYWRDPGAFAEYLDVGALGRFHGFMGAMSSALFTVVGPEYLAMVAGEAKNPRRYLKAGFKTVYWRFGFFFIVGALCVGIVIPHTQPELGAGHSSAEGSPYVIAMSLMGIDVLPHVVNALLCTSIFSAGNAYTYCSMRCLYGLALQGHAPAVFKKCLKNGIPIWSFVAVMCFPFLTFFQVSAGTAKVVGILQSLTSASGLLNYVSIAVSYIFFHRACKAQGVDRRTLPFRGYFQPYLAYIGLFWMILMVLTFGYTVFMADPFVPLDFFSYYLMVIISVLAFGGWKLFRKTRFVRPHEADLVWDRPIIDAYERQFTKEPTRFRDDVKKLFRRGKKSGNQAELAHDQY